MVEADGSDIWQALDANYDEIVREAFEGQEYPFGKSRQELTGRQAGTFGYDDAFLMPIDVIHISEVYLNDCSARDLQEKWEINAETRQLLIDASNRKVEIEFIKVGMEYTWSAKFARGVQRRLEAVIKDVLEEMEESQALDSEADMHFLSAGTKASKNRSGTKVRRGGRLTRAHRGNTSRYYGDH